MAHGTEDDGGQDRESRKRSNTVLLTLMGAGAGALIVAELWPSSSDVDASVFQNVETCINSGRYDQRTCEKAFEEVAHHHVAMAPRFATRADCEADFAPGSCEPLPASSGAAPSYAPVVAGVLLGAAAGAGAAAALPPLQPVYRSCNANPTDVCQTSGSGRTSGGGFYTCSGYRVGSSYGSATVHPAAFSTSAASTQALSRGGFGSRARAMSVSS